MNLVRYNNREYRPVSFSNIVDKFFNDSFYSGETSAFRPQVDVVETEGSYEISFSVPGIEKELINIDIENGKLTVSGERKMEEKTEKRNYRTIESNYGSFSRSFFLPENIDDEHVEAHHENGILNIIIPKVEPKTTLKKIEIK